MEDNELLMKKRQEILKKREEEKKKIQKKRKKIKGIFVLICVLLVMCIAFAVLSFTVFFKIKNIEVVGETTYDASEVILSSGVEIGDNLLSLNAEKIVNKITKALLYVDKAEIDRKLPNTLILTVTQTEEKYDFYGNGSYYAAGPSCKAYELLEEPNENAIKVKMDYLKTIEIGEVVTFADESQTKAFNTIVDLIQEGKIQGITHIFMGDDASINVVYENRIDWKTPINEELTRRLLFAYSVSSNEEYLDKGFTGYFHLEEYTVDNPSARSQIYEISNLIEKVFSEEDNTENKEETSSLVVSNASNITSSKVDFSVVSSISNTSNKESSSVTSSKTTSNTSSAENSTTSKITSSEEKSGVGSKTSSTSSKSVASNSNNSSLQQKTANN